MDDFLALLGSQALRYAIRSGITLSSTFAIGQFSRLLTTINDHGLQTKLRQLQSVLETKVKVWNHVFVLCHPAYRCILDYHPCHGPRGIQVGCIGIPTLGISAADICRSGRGNIFLDSALPLTKSIQEDISSLGQRMEALATKNELHGHTASNSERISGKGVEEIKQMLQHTTTLLDRIDREIPFLQLAISASGESLSTSLPAGISPSRLLQASTLLTVGDTQHSRSPFESVQIGPVFTLSLYMLFLGHANPPSHSENAWCTDRGVQGSSGERTAQPAYGLKEGDRKPIWQEVIHKARITLIRDPDGLENANSRSSTGTYAYRLNILEDLDDGRVHSDSDQTISSTDEAIPKHIPIHHISKIFYTDSGRLLNIGDADGSRRPVLLLKRDLGAQSARAISNDDAVEFPAVCNNDKIRLLAIEESDEQAEIDLQLREEAGRRVPPAKTRPDPQTEHPWEFPSHLDQEWLAMEIFEADFDSCESSDMDDEVGIDGQDANIWTKRWQATDCNAPPAVCQLETQIRNLSLLQRDSSSAFAQDQMLPHQPSPEVAENETFMSRSPFGAIVTSLSLIEMLIRLASLQEFQQTSHLAIPDHILTFFLEEASTTGLVGKAQWKARHQAKEKVGFDPYMDKSTKRI